MCHLANGLQWAHNEAQGPLEVKSSPIFGPVDSNQFLFFPLEFSLETQK